MMDRQILTLITLLGMALVVHTRTTTVGPNASRIITNMKRFSGTYQWGGHVSYVKINNYLVDNVRTDVVKQNVKGLNEMRESLINERSPPASLMNALAAMLGMVALVDKGTCNHALVNSLSLNLKGIGGVQDEDNRVQAIVHEYLRRALEKCLLTIEERFGEEVKKVDEDRLKALTNYLDNGVIEEYSKKFGSPYTPTYGEMISNEDWKPNGESLILGRLFDVGFDLLLEHKSTDHKEFSKRQWKQVDFEKLVSLVREYISLPCASFLRAIEFEVFKLHYLGAKTFPGYKEEFLSAISDDMKYDLFRYEFCQAHTGQRFYRQLWRNYLLKVNPKAFDEETFK